MPSTAIDQFHYNTESAILRVRFISGAVYDYLAVPEKLFGKMTRASSKGKFLNRHIKGKFRFEKVDAA